MRKEIGSEFYELPLSNNESVCKAFDSNEKYFLSGRTAIDFLIKDIKLTRPFKSVLLPSYLCDTMIIPFVENNIKISFYDVILDKNGLDFQLNTQQTTDAFVVMNYFGFQSPAIEKHIDKLANQNIVIIKDITQSLFSETKFDVRADYVFASLRKWMGVPDGALLVKRNSKFNIAFPQVENKDFINLRLAAMRMKENYIIHKQGSKTDYLKKFTDASSLLAKNYTGYRMSDYTMNLLLNIGTDNLIKKRRENATFLIFSLYGFKGIQLLFNEVKSNDVPLFVPILVKNGHRNKLRNYLINKKIYCPVHWPLTKFHLISDENKVIYYQELSIICDQRYNTEDMTYIVNEIKSYFRNE